MDTITITVAENDPDVIVSATLNEDAVTITLNEAATGATGAGVPTGGSANDILKKTSSTNYATAWETPTSAATANAVVRRDASGGAAFDDLTAVTVATASTIATTGNEASISTSGESASIFTYGGYASIYTSGNAAEIYTEGTAAQIYTSGMAANISTVHQSASVRSTNFAAYDATAGAALRDSAGAAYLTWGATAGNISIAVDTTSTGHFFSNPGTATAGHFLTKNGTTPTIVAGRSAWFSSTAGAPQFRNGTGSAVTLIYSGGELGTPSSGTLTNCTGLPVSTGISGLGAGIATFLATPGTNVAMALAINVGTAGAFVVNGGALGTPSSGTLTSCTGLPISTGLSGLGTGVATFLATPSSANLLLALTTSTGTGSAVFATSPTITTPTISRASTGLVATFQDNNGASATVTTDANGRNFFVVNGKSGAVGNGGAYVQLNGYEEAWTTLNVLSNTSGQRVMRFGTLSNRFSIQRLNDAISSITATPFSFANDAPTNSFYMLTSGTVGFGTSTPSEKALLDLTSTTKGFLPPRMTTGQRDAITSVPAGLMVYNTTTNKLNFYNGSAWEAVTSA